MTDRISDAEYAVMEVLWHQAPQDAAMVAQSLETSQGWTLATVKTLLSRLASKGAVETTADGRKFLYSPLIQRSNYVAGESQRLVDRLFGGKLSPLVAHLAEREALSADDIAEIEALIKGLKA
jgi:BlaI family transcriptional regulator, penicillinase repressor